MVFRVVDLEIIEDGRGSKYQGGYVNGAKSGEGTFTWPDGRIYWGQWSEGLQEGFGVTISADGVASQARRSPSRGCGVWRSGRELEVWAVMRMRRSVYGNTPDHNIGCHDLGHQEQEVGFSNSGSSKPLMFLGNVTCDVPRASQSVTPLRCCGLWGFRSVINATLVAIV
eukprot:30513-Amphidinium_carterae.1